MEDNLAKLTESYESVMHRDCLPDERTFLISPEVCPLA